MRPLSVITGIVAGSCLSISVSLAAVLLLIDLVVFFLPLTAILLAYVIVLNPGWARDFINRLDTPAS